MRKVTNLAAMVAAVTAREAIQGADWGPSTKRRPMPTVPKNRDKVKAARKQRRKAKP